MSAFCFQTNFCSLLLLVFIACFPSPRLSLSLSLVLQCVDVSTDLESRSQFDVHAGHQMVLGQQQQSLAVDLLQPESLGHVTAAWAQTQTQVKFNTNKSYGAGAYPSMHWVRGGVHLGAVSPGVL